MSKKYEVQDGAVLCDGARIAEYDAGANRVITPEPLHHKVKAAISRVIEPNPEYVVDSVFAQLGEPNTAPDPEAFRVNPQVDTLPDVAPTEPPPPSNAMLGDKCPVFIEWFRRNHSPEEFEARYRGRKIPSGPVSVSPEPSTRME